MAASYDRARRIRPATADVRLEATPARLGPLTLGLFSSPALPLAGLVLALIVYLPHFYVSYLGISLTTIGAIFTVVRIVDLCVDPILGSLMDRTTTRFGRFRPWLIAGLPILMIAAYLVFMPPRDAGPLYLIGAVSLAYLGYSIGVIGQLSWGAVLADDYRERSRLFGWVQASTQGGMVLLLVLPTVLGRIAPSSEAAGVAAMGWFVIVATPITILLAVARAPEPLSTYHRSPPASLAQYLAAIRRPTVLRIVICTLLLASAPGITGAIFLFFFRQARGFSLADANLVALIYFTCAVLGAPVWSWLANRLGKHRALWAACAYHVVFQVLVYLIPSGNLAIAIPVLALSGASFSADMILLRAMTADACDEARLEVAADCTGVIYALQTTGTKIGSVVGVALTFPLLEKVFHFQPKAAHSSTLAVHGLEFAYVVLPILFIAAAALCLIGYRLTETRHQAIRAALDARGAAAAAPSETELVPPFIAEGHERHG